jgi:hypothetical protein
LATESEENSKEMLEEFRQMNKNLRRKIKEKDMKIM